MIISSVVSAASRFIRSLAILLLLAPLTAFADFCSVDNFGNITSCFPSADMCQQWARTSQGRCVLRQSGGAPSGGGAPQGGDWLGNLQGTFSGIAERQRAAMAEAARRTPPYILLLAPSNYPHTLDTVAIIDSTLKTALEMEVSEATHEWSNPSANRKGAVAVGVAKPNQFGDICKQFFVVSSTRSEPRAIKGNACRKAGNWEVLGATPVEIKDGEVIGELSLSGGATNVYDEKSTNDKPIPITEKLPNSTTEERIGIKAIGGHCVSSPECEGNSVCRDGKCVASNTSESNVKSKNNSTKVSNRKLNESCEGDNWCNGNLICVQGMCRHQIQNELASLGDGGTTLELINNCSDQALKANNQISGAAPCLGDRKLLRYYNNGDDSYYLYSNSVLHAGKEVTVDILKTSGSGKAKASLRLVCSNSTYNGLGVAGGQLKGTPHEALLKLCK